MDGLDFQALEVDVIVEVERQGQQPIDLRVLLGQILIKFIDLGLPHLDVRGLGLAFVALAFCLRGSRHRGVRPLLLRPCALCLCSSLRERSSIGIRSSLGQALLVLHLGKKSASACHVLSPSLIERISLY